MIVRIASKWDGFSTRSNNNVMSIFCQKHLIQPITLSITVNGTDHVFMKTFQELALVYPHKELITFGPPNF